MLINPLNNNSFTLNLIPVQIGIHKKSLPYSLLSPYSIRRIFENLKNKKPLKQSALRVSRAGNGTRTRNLLITNWLTFFI
jgi:hypothetical protein